MERPEPKYPWNKYEEEAKDACCRHDYDKAGKVLIDALKKAEEFKIIDPRIFNALHTLAATHCMERRYKEAEYLYHEGLKVREKILGAHHPDVVDSLKRLAVVVHETRGRAESMIVAFRAQSLAANLYGPRMAGVES